MTQQWDFPVDEPVSLPERRQNRLAGQLASIAARVQGDDTLRAIAAENGVSHEALRQALKRAGLGTRPLTMPAVAPRRERIHRLPGRGRSTVFAPSDVTALLLRHRAGESMRSLARASGVSHETIRRVLAAPLQTVTTSATA